MRKRKFSIFVTPMLILGLVACNNDTNDAMDTQNGNQMNTANQAGTNVYQVNNRNQGTDNRDDRNALGFDHRGPLTEDYLDRDNNRAANNNRPTYWTVRNNNDLNRNNGGNATNVNHANSRNNGRNAVGVNNNNNNNGNSQNNNRNNIIGVNNNDNVRNGNSGYRFDHRGPLTEDYTDRDDNRATNNNRPMYNIGRDNNDMNRNNGNRATRVNYNNNDYYNVRNNGNKANRANDNYDNDNARYNTGVNNNRNTTNVNWSRNNNANWGTRTTDPWGLENVTNRNETHNKNARNKDLANTTDEDLNLSSLKTSQSSKKYPHTKAVLIQEARYQFIPVNPNQDNRLQARLRQNKELAQAPEEQQKQQQAAPAQQEQAPAKQQTPAQQEQAKQGANVSQAVQQVIDLTNEQRRKNGLPALQADTQLSRVAQMKSTDMQQKGYFSHTSPTYGSPFDMMRDQGVSYRTAGENIAQGQRTPQEVVNAWMNSEGHRKNILSREFTHIGVGYDANGHHWTQMFIGK